VEIKEDSLEIIAYRRGKFTNERKDSKEGDKKLMWESRSVIDCKVHRD
jgi:hypothetical protein